MVQVLTRAEATIFEQEIHFKDQKSAPPTVTTPPVLTRAAGTPAELITVIPVSLTKSLGESLSQLNSLLTLSQNWDSYGGLPPTTEAVAKADSFLQIVYDSALARFPWGEIRPHRIAALPDGGIHLSWMRPQREIEIEFSPEGNLGFLYVEKQDGIDENYQEQNNAAWWIALSLVNAVLEYQG